MSMSDIPTIRGTKTCPEVQGYCIPPTVSPYSANTDPAAMMTFPLERVLLSVALEYGPS